MTLDYPGGLTYSQGPYEEAGGSGSVKGDMVMEPEVRERDLEIECCWP